MNDNPSTSWWQRNWKWFVPAGCLSMIALMFVGIGGIVLMAMTMFKSADVYEQALLEARSHPELRRVLGEPIEDGFFPSGSLSTQGPTGEADLAIPLSGPNGEATLYLIATKSAGVWTFQTLEAELKADRRRVNLLQDRGQ